MKSKLLEQVISAGLANAYRQGAKRAFARGTPKQHNIGLELAKRANQSSPKLQAMRKRLM